MLTSLVAAGLSALAAIVAAVIAARSASKTRGLQADLERLRLLENRVSEKKRETYQPMIDLLGKMLDGEEADRLSEDEMREQLRKFGSWIVIFGSDEAVTAFRNFMQGTYSDVPAPIPIRLAAEFQIAARRDMGDPETGIGAVEIVGMRIKDLHTGDPGFLLTLKEPFKDACARHGWDAPWLKSPSPEQRDGG